jgi:hypothetical protein
VGPPAELERRTCRHKFCASRSHMIFATKKSARQASELSLKARRNR